MSIRDEVALDAALAAGATLEGLQEALARRRSYRDALDRAYNPRHAAQKADDGAAR